jgi:hypothetical protein
MIRAILWGMAAVWVAGAVVAVRRAPAVSIALVGSLLISVHTFLYVRPEGPRGVPVRVGASSFVALAAFGLFGLVVTRPRASRERLRRAALWACLLAPVAAVGLWLLLAEACPIYVTKGSGLCFHMVDVLGGWLTGAAILLGLDLLTLGAILAVAASQVPGSSPAGIGEAVR